MYVKKHSANLGTAIPTEALPFVALTYNVIVLEFGFLGSDQTTNLSCRD